MILSTQKNEIRKFLLSKKLSLDILMEVEDHFIIQTENLQMTENINFNYAFQKVKENWSPDLKIVTYYNGSEISLFAKKIRDRQINKILLKSIILTIIFFLVFCSFIKTLEKQDFTNLFTYLIFVVLGIPAIHYFCNIKTFKISSEFKPVKLNIYQSSNSLLIFCGFLPIIIGNSFQDVAQRIYDFVESSSRIGFASTVLFVIFLWFYSFGFLLQIAFIKSMNRLKPLLKNFDISKS